MHEVLYITDSSLITVVLKLSVATKRTTTMTNILVTGGTGNNGRAVLEHLARTEIPVRAMLRDPAKAAVKAPNVHYVAGDFEDARSLSQALEGIEVAFLVTAYEPTFPAKHAAFIRAAEAAGVRQIVQLSGVGANVGSQVRTLQWLGKAEDHLRDSSLDWTILRAATFHNNFYASASTIANDGILAGPYGTASDATLTLVDNRDIGAVAAEVLVNPTKHQGQVYTLTGSEQLNHTQIAAVFAKVLDRPVVYQPISDEQAKAGLLEWQVPEAIADSLVELWAAMREGDLRPEVTNDVARILDREPISFEQFVRAEAHRFQPEHAA